MSKFNRETLLKAIAKPAKPEQVTVGDQSFYIRKISVKEQSELAKLNEDKDADVFHGVANLALVALSDEDGNQLLTADDLDAVLQMPTEMLFSLADHINRFNGFNKTVETAEKN